MAVAFYIDSLSTMVKLQDVIEGFQSNYDNNLFIEI
jgi:hypothetical protein